MTKWLAQYNKSCSLGSITGLCNDNAYGLTACARTAKAMGTTPPCSMMGDFSLIDRKSEENGVAEAASPFNENVGFMVSRLFV